MTIRRVTVNPFTGTGSSQTEEASSRSTNSSFGVGAGLPTQITESISGRSDLAESVSSSNRAQQASSDIVITSQETVIEALNPTQESSSTEYIEDALEVRFQNLGIAVNDLKVLLNSISDSNSFIFPNVLSHEIVKTQGYENTFIAGYSGNSCDNTLTKEKAEEIFVSYIDNVHEMNAFRVFNTIKETPLLVDLHYKKVKEKVENLQNIFKDLNFIFENEYNIKSKYNFANKFRDYFASGISNKSFNKIYNKIFVDFGDFNDNQALYLSDSTVSSPDDNSFLSYNIYNTESNQYLSSDALRSVYRNIFRKKDDLSDLNDDNVRINRLLNSDKTIGLLMTNSVLSHSEPYFGCWNITSDLTLNDDENNLLNAFNSYSLERFTIVNLSNTIGHLFANNNVTFSLFNPSQSISMSNTQIEDVLSDNILKDNTGLNSLDYYNDKTISNKIEKELGFYLYTLNNNNLPSATLENDYDFQTSFSDDRTFYTIPKEEKTSLGVLNSITSNYQNNLIGYDFLCYDDPRIIDSGIQSHHLHFFALDFKGNFRDIKNETKRNLSSPLFTYFIGVLKQGVSFNDSQILENIQPNSSSDKLKNYSFFADSENPYTIETVQIDKKNGDTTRTEQFIDVTNINRHENLNFSIDFFEESYSNHTIKYSSSLLDNTSSTRRLIKQKINSSYRDRSEYPISDVLIDYPGFINRLDKNYNKSINSKIVSEKMYPYIFLNNTNSTVPYGKIKEKFIDLNSDLTSEKERFSDRIVNSSQRIEDTNNTRDVKEFKNKSFINLSDDKKGSAWISHVFKIKRLLGKIKSYKIQDNNTFNYYTNFKEKLKTKKEKRFVFLHEDNSSNSIFSLDESNFLINSSESVYSKSNFINTNLQIKNTSETLFDEEISSDDLKVFDNFNSQSYREFLGLYYPKSFLRNSTNFYLRILNDVHNNLKNISRDSIVDNTERLAYEKLLSDTIASGKKEVIKFLVYTSLCKHNNLANDFTNWNSSSKRATSYNKINNNSDNIYKSYIDSIFNRENIENQKSYTIRIFTNDFLNSYYTLGTEFLGTRGEGGDVDRGDGENQGMLGFIDSKIKQFIFPFQSHDISIPHISSFVKVNTDSKKLNLRTKTPTSDLSPNLYPEADLFVNQFINAQSFNHDNYLVGFDFSDDVKENTPNVENNVQFDVDNQKCGLYYYVLKDISKINENINQLASDSSLRGVYSYYNEYNTNEENYKILDLNSDLNYEIKGITTFDRYAYDLEFNNRLSKNIHDYIVDILKYTGSDAFTSLESITSFVNSNDEILDHIFDVLSLYCNLYSFKFDQIVELSVRSSLNEVIKVYDDNSIYENIDGTFMWNDNIRDACLGMIKGNLRRYSIVNNIDTVVRSETSVVNLFYTKSDSDIDLILRTLNNSDHLEALTFDAIHSYLINNEETISNIENISSDLQSIFNRLNDKLGLIEDLESIEAKDILSNNLKLCKVSKNLQNMLFFNFDFFNRLYPPGNELQNIVLEDIYKNIDYFSHRKLEIREGIELSEIGLQNIYTREDTNNIQKFDIIRFGIDYDIASLLSNEKLLNIKVYISNHKYPEIVFKPFNFYYTPVLTNITPAHYSLIKNDLINISELTNFLGYYDFNSINFEQKYAVINKKDAELIVKNIVGNRNLINQLFENEIQFGLDPETASAAIVDHAQRSNLIKYTNFIKNKIFNENKINRINLEKDNIMSDDILEIYNNITDESFEKSFLETKSVVEEFLSSSEEFSAKDFKRNLIDSSIHSLDTLKLLDKDISKIDNLLEFTTEEYFDIFSIKISRSAIRNKIQGGEAEVRRLYNILENDPLPMSNSDFDDSYSYIIEMQVI